MFKKAAADMLGLSDIGAVIRPENYDKVDADDYVMHEDGEKIYFLIKSKSDEYCFTNLALIHLDGTSAISKKRTLNRYPYYLSPITAVSIETAGTVDLDVEIKFTIGDRIFSIDVHKKHLEEIKDLYKSLNKISEITYDNEIKLSHSKESLAIAANTLSSINKLDGNLVEQFNGINQSAYEWMEKSYKQYKVKDFAPIFERYIHF
ncbi:PH domain-containing protein [Paenibacillus sp. FJAT-26967]|uniref:PH domain-containing protein n=1 Tax=Paenibacillus sp. FJAT-26967 TaxID=1729690 RepID=UPI0008390E8E|nr:PH domain-containing protein [Paenibacillus sp. FJAT-26967]